MDTQTVPYQPGVLLRGFQLSGGVLKNNFFSFISSWNLVKSHSILD